MLGEIVPPHRIAPPVAFELFLAGADDADLGIGEDRVGRADPVVRELLGGGHHGLRHQSGAREKAQEARGQLAEGLDPIAVKKLAREVPTFGAMADELIEWKSNASPTISLKVKVESIAIPFGRLPRRLFIAMGLARLAFTLENIASRKAF